MKVLLIGAGGVGGYLAAKCVQCGIDTTLFATPKTNEFIAKNGLQVTGVEELSVCIKTKLSGIYDVIIITTKSYHLDDIIPILEKHSNQGTIVLPLLNGVGHFEELENLVGFLEKDEFINKYYQELKNR